MSLAFNKSSTGLTVFLNGEMYTVPVDAPNYRKVLAGIKDKDEGAIYSAINVAEAVAEAFSSVVGVQSRGIEVTSEGVFVGGSKMHNALSTKIMEFMSAGLSFEPLVKFLGKFMENPLVKLASNPEVLAMMGKSAGQAHEIVDEFTDDFYSFLNNKDLPVTDEGNFLAYKSVSGDYFSVTAGNTTLTKGKVVNRRVYNGIGEEIECDRGQVDPSRRNECSYGLHVGSLEYVNNFGGEKKIIVEVNPKDVVAIPPDCNRQKMRVCAYKVIQDCKQALTKPAYKTSDYDEDFDLYDEDYDEFDDDFTDVDEVTVESIYIGDEIKFDYTHDGETKTRYLDVTEYGFVNGKLDRLIGLLMAPEEHEGQYRSFKVEKMRDIYYI